VSPANQRHDFNADIDPFPSGLFWTTRIAAGSTQVNLDAGTASIDVTDVALQDYGNVANSLADGPSFPSSATCHVRWSGVTKRVNRKSTHGFGGEFVETGAQMAFSASNTNGFSYTSAPIGTSFSIFAQIGHERNGKFFHA
jgi:hypothetical protein